MRLRHLLPSVIGLAVAALWIGQVWPSFASAADNAPASAADNSPGAVGNPAATTPSASKVDDATIKKAAVVLPKIRQINDETRAAVQKTNDPQQRQQIVSQARDKQLSTLRNAGLTPDQYEKVLLAFNTDPSVKAKLESYLSGGGQAQ